MNPDYPSFTEISTFSHFMDSDLKIKHVVTKLIISAIKTWKKVYSEKSVLACLTILFDLISSGEILSRSEIELLRDLLKDTDSTLLDFNCTDLDSLTSVVELELQHLSQFCDIEPISRLVISHLLCCFNSKSDIEVVEVEDIEKKVEDSYHTEALFHRVSRENIPLEVEKPRVLFIEDSVTKLDLKSNIESAQGISLSL